MAEKEYIEREAAINEVLVGDIDKDFPRMDIAARLHDIPAADVRPMGKATWIIKEMKALLPGMDEHPVFACSECGYQIYDLLDDVKERHHFCPNCGAEMEA